MEEKRLRVELKRYLNVGVGAKREQLPHDSTQSSHSQVPRKPKWKEPGQAAFHF